MENKIKIAPLPSLIGLVVIFSVLFMLKRCDPEGNPETLNFTTRAGASSANLANRWHYKFGFMNGGVQGSFTARSDAARLVYSGNIEEGSILFQLYGPSDTLIFTFPEQTGLDTLAGVFRNGQRYTVRATAKGARGEFEFRME